MRFAFVVLLATALSSCSILGTNLAKPEMSLINIESLPSGNLEQLYALTFRILNPNEVTLPIRGLSYSVNIQGKPFATGASPDDLDIEAFGSSEFTVEVSTNVFRTAQVLLELLRSRPETIDYQLLAKIKTRIPVMGTVEVTRTGSINVSGLAGPS